MSSPADAAATSRTIGLSRAEALQLLLLIDRNRAPARMPQAMPMPRQLQPGAAGATPAAAPQMPALVAAPPPDELAPLRDKFYRFLTQD